MSDISQIAESLPTLDGAPQGQIDLERIAREYEARAKAEDAELRWKSACPPALQSTDWEHPALNRAACDAVHAYSLGFKGILASGPTGRGKSRAIWALMRRLAVCEGIEARYWHSSEFFATLQGKINYGRDEAQGWVEAVARRRIVFIDDLGQEAIQTSRQEWAQSWFFRFLDIRVGEKLPLFITTNLTAQDIAGSQSNVRANPLLRRLLDLCDVIKF